MSGPTVPILTLLSAARDFVNHHDFPQACGILWALAGKMPTQDTEEALKAYLSAVIVCQMFPDTDMDSLGVVWATEAVAYEHLTGTLLQVATEATS